MTDDGEGRPPREKPATSLTGEQICTERDFREREGLGSCVLRAKFQT